MAREVTEFKRIRPNSHRMEQGIPRLPSLIAESELYIYKKPVVLQSSQYDQLGWNSVSLFRRQILGCDHVAIKSNHQIS